MCVASVLYECDVSSEQLLLTTVCSVLLNDHQSRLSSRRMLSEPRSLLRQRAASRRTEKMRT